MRGLEVRSTLINAKSTWKWKLSDLDKRRKNFSFCRSQKYGIPRKKSASDKANSQLLIAMIIMDYFILADSAPSLAQPCERLPFLRAQGPCLPAWRVSHWLLDKFPPLWGQLWACVQNDNGPNSPCPGDALRVSLFSSVLSTLIISS